MACSGNQDLIANRGTCLWQDEAEGDKVLGEERRDSRILAFVATKLKAIQDRDEAKDYLDVDRWLQEGADLGEALAAARAVYGPSFNPVLNLKALCYFCDGDLESLPEKVRSRLLATVRRVDAARLPELQPLSGGLVP